MTIVQDMRLKLDIEAHPTRGSWEDYYRELVQHIESAGIDLHPGKVPGTKAGIVTMTFDCAMEQANCSQTEVFFELFDVFAIVVPLAFWVQLIPR